jgi:hypothetical protein
VDTPEVTHILYRVRRCRVTEYARRDGNEYSQELIDLAFAALDHGIDSVREGGPLIPFVMTERDEARTLDRFASDLLEDAVAQAVAHVQASRSQPGTRHVLAYDGYLTDERLQLAHRAARSPRRRRVARCAPLPVPATTPELPPATLRISIPP